MPIDIQCEKCKKRFRVPDKVAGRRIKCPNCGKPIEVPAAGDNGKARPATGAGVGSTSAATGKPSQPDSANKLTAEAGSEPALEVAEADEGQWYMQTDDGEQYGPVDREELEAWVAEGRVDGTCQLLCDGWDQWRWADEVFPRLSEDASTEDSPIVVQSDSSKAIRPAISTHSDMKKKSRPAGATSHGVSTAGVERTLAETRPWVLLMAIVGFVIAGLGTLGGMVGMVLSALAPVVPGILTSLVIVATYGLVGWAAFHLFVYAQCIQAYVANSGTAELQRALVAQRSFWRLAGILTLVALAAWILTAVLVIIAAAVGVGVATAA